MKRHPPLADSVGTWEDEQGRLHSAWLRKRDREDFWSLVTVLTMAAGVVGYTLYVVLQ